MRLFSAGITVFFMSCRLLLAPAVMPGLDLPVRQIPDDSALRTSIKDTWFTEIPQAALSRRPAMHTLPGGGRVELRTQAVRDEFMVILARELAGGRVNDAFPVNASETSARPGSGNFPGWAQGSWILTRRRDTGAALRIRVFLRSDPYTYIQFRPLGADKCQMDVVIYDAYVVRSLPLALPFERLYTLPLEEALKLAGDKFPGKYFDPNPADYRDQRLLIRRIQERLPELRFADDGAIDENGNYVFIETLLPQGRNIQISHNKIREPLEGLNCSGFSKWLIDGLLRPVTGQRLAIPALKAPYGSRGSSFTEIWEELRDPFFGLDWIRNLAAAANSTLRSPVYGTLEEFEVRADPFALIIARNKSGAESGLSGRFWLRLRRA